MGSCTLLSELASPGVNLVGDRLPVAVISRPAMLHGGRTSLYRFYTLQDDVDRPHLNPANRISPSAMPFASMTSEDVAAFYSLLDE